MSKFVAFLLLVVLFFGIRADAAKRCYSGQNARYIEKQCSSGSMAQDFTCQKFTCEGGKSQFISRSCSLRSERACEYVERECLEFLGVPRCMTCDTDLCNGEPQIPPLELQESHLTNNGLFNFSKSKPSQFNIDRIPSVMDVNAKYNCHEAQTPSIFVFLLLLARGLFCWAHF